MSIDMGELCRAKESMSAQVLLDDLYIMSGVLVIHCAMKWSAHFHY
jgi:hypothetical protein